MSRMLFLPAVLALLCIGCNLDQHKQETRPSVAKADQMTGEQMEQATDSLQLPQQPPPEENPEREKQVPSTPINWDKKIVKTANLQVEVKDHLAYGSVVSQLVKKSGGYIQQEQQQSSPYQKEQTVIIKVPVDRFEEMMHGLVQQADQVREKQISSEDVTTQLIDGRSRLEAKKSVRQRYLELLKGARNMQEILEVQKEINSIQEEIELVNGRINYLGHAAAMSTIHLTYIQVLNAKVPEVKEPVFLAQLRDSFVNGGRWLGSVFLALVSIWPLWLMLAIVVVVLKKRFSWKPKA